MSDFGWWFARARSTGCRAAVLLALWGAPLAAAETRPPPSPDVDRYFSDILLSLQKRTLETGLDVVLNVNRSTPAVALSVTFPQGRRDGNVAPEIVDYLRHHRAVSGRADYDLVRARGAIEHRDDGWDHTSFTLVLPSSELAFGLWLEGQRFQAISELPQRVQQVASTDQHVLALLHPTEVARLQLEREMWQVPDVTAQLVPRTLNEHYFDPGAAVLTISGDFDSDRALGLLGEYLGQAGAPDRAPLASTSPDAKESGRTGLAPIDTNSSPQRAAKMLLGWMGPSTHDPEYAAFQVLVHLLTNPSSNWNERLRAAARASTLDGEISDARDRSFLALEVGVDDKRQKSSIKSLLRVLRALATRPPSQRVVVNAQKALLLQWLGRFAAAETRAELFGRYETLAGDARLATRHHQFLARVTPEAVQRVLAERMVAHPPLTLSTGSARGAP